MDETILTLRRIKDRIDEAKKKLFDATVSIHEIASYMERNETPLTDFSRTYVLRDLAEANKIIGKALNEWFILSFPKDVNAFNQREKDD